MKAPGKDAWVAARAEYKGRPCYVAGRIGWDGTVQPVMTKDESRYLLYSLDGARQWWAPRQEIVFQKWYNTPKTIRALEEYRALYRERR